MSVPASTHVPSTGSLNVTPKLQMICSRWWVTAYWWSHSSGLHRATKRRIAEHPFNPGDRCQISTAQRSPTMRQNPDREASRQITTDLCTLL